MKTLAFALFALSITPRTIAQDTNVEDVSKVLTSSGVVPTVLPPFTVKAPFEVSFKSVTVTAGANLTNEQTSQIPSFAIRSKDQAIAGKAYTIALVDPDAPSPPNRTLGQFLHFIGKDYLSSPDGDSFVLKNTSSPIIDFVPPGPPPGSPPHRYVWALYEQLQLGVTPPSQFNFSDPNIRLKFNLTRFVEEVGGLNLVSATMFFEAPADAESDPSTASNGGGNNDTSTTASANAARSTSGSVRKAMPLPLFSFLGVVTMLAGMASLCA